METFTYWHGQKQRFSKAQKPVILLDCLKSKRSKVKSQRQCCEQVKYIILFFRFLKNRCFCHDRMCSPVRGLMWGEDFYQKTAIKREQKENSFSLCRAWAGSTKSNCFHVKIFDLHHKVLKALTSCYGVFIVFVKISPARMLNTGNSEWSKNAPS